jgi:hypothetical protein
LEENAILWVRIREGAEMNGEAMANCFAVYKQLCGKKKVVQIIDSRAACSMTKEGKKYSAVHSPQFFTAHAVITELLSVRMLVDVYNKMHKHSVPFQVFRNEKDARSWLKQYMR